MQVAHKEGERGSYLTVKDNQVCCSSVSSSFHCFPSFLGDVREKGETDPFFLWLK